MYHTVFFTVILGQLLALSQQIFSPTDSLFAEVNNSGENTSPPEKPFVSSGVFLQQVHQRFSTGNGLPSDDIRHLLIVNGHVYAGTAAGIADGTSGHWKLIVPTGTPVTALAFGRQQLWYIENDSVFSVTEGSAPAVKLMPDSSVTLQTLHFAGDQLFVGTASGLLILRNGLLQAVDSVNSLLQNNASVRQIASTDDELAVAASGGLVTLHLKSGQASLQVPRDRQQGWALLDVRGAGYDAAGSLWFAAPQGAGRRSGSEWTLYTGHEGLPWNDFTCIAAGDANDVWFGTTLGAIHFLNGEWEYRQGKRWLMDDHVRSISTSPDKSVWLATSSGISQIQAIPITLKQKSIQFNDAIDRFHKRTEFGYVDSVSLKSPGDTSEWTQHDSDNDGLWTSMYGAAQCFEYAATRSPAAKHRASDAFRAVAFLSEVPQGSSHAPPPGFPARSILPVTGRNPNLHDSPEHDRRRQKEDPLWKVLSPRWPTSADGKWYWKTDTSSDELDGHYFFYALYHDLVAETAEEKRAVREVVDRVTSHLIDHNFSLVDHDGKPTRWGQYAPDVLNSDKLTDCRGLNSLSILSYLLVAQHVTGDEKYSAEYRKLLFEHNYFTNILVPKTQNGPGSGNQSDDEMAFMCYYTALSCEKDPEIRLQFMRSLARYFAQEESERCPLFNFIFAQRYEPVEYFWPSVPKQIVDDAMDTLKRFPLDRIRWGQKNSHRLDIIPLGAHIIESDGKGGRIDGRVLPVDERFVNQWNHDPWQLDGGGNGTELADGTAFLLPYWMGVYHGLIRETASDN